MDYQRTEVVQPSGIVKDLSPFEMPPNIWTDGDNINFRRGRTNSSLGNSNPYTDLVLAASPTYMQWFTDDVDSFWLYTADTVGDSIVATTDGLTTTTIGSGFTASRKLSWTGCDFNSVIVLNNRADHPQQVSEPYDVCVPLENWDSTTPWGASSRCEVIRPYKNYLIAMDCYDESGKRFSNMVRWSGPAQLGDVPNSWDPNIVGDQAGLYALADTPGRMVDGLTLGDYFVLYKTDAVWLMQFIGGAFTMSFRKIFGGDTGILSKSCVTEFEGKHFVLAPQTCYVHNGSSKEDVMDGWVKDEFFDNVDFDFIDETKVVADHNHSEIWIYYISKKSVENAALQTLETEPFADRALVWNWVEKSWTRKELNNIAYIAEGYVNPKNTLDDSWDSDVSSYVPPYNSAWNKDRTRWDGEITFSPVLESLLMSNYYDQKFYALEYTSGSDLYNPLSWVERIGIDFNNDRRFKMLDRIVPHIKGQNPVTITVYASDVQTPNPTVQAVVTFDPLVDEDVDVHVVGRYLGLRFECEDLFTINGYTLEWTPTGNY